MATKKATKAQISASLVAKFWSLEVEERKIFLPALYNGTSYTTDDPNLLEVLAVSDRTVRQSIADQLRNSLGADAALVTMIDQALDKVGSKVNPVRAMVVLACKLALIGATKGQIAWTIKNSGCAQVTEELVKLLQRLVNLDKEVLADLINQYQDLIPDNPDNLIEGRYLYANEKVLVKQLTLLGLTINEIEDFLSLWRHAHQRTLTVENVREIRILSLAIRVRMSPNYGLFRYMLFAEPLFKGGSRSLIADSARIEEGSKLYQSVIRDTAFATFWFASLDAPQFGRNWIMVVVDQAYRSPDRSKITSVVGARVLDDLGNLGDPETFILIPDQKMVISDQVVCTLNGQEVSGPDQVFETALKAAEEPVTA